jgi:hypothetical protein
METRSDPPEPYTWACRDCGQPIRIWDAGGPGPDSPYSLVPVWCVHCWAKRYPSEKQEAVLQFMHAMERDIRRCANLPRGTLISLRDQIPKLKQKGHGPVALPGIGFFVVVNAWDPVWPHPQYPWVDGYSRWVLLAGYAKANQDSKVGCIVSWSWLYPDAEPMTRWDPADYSPTRAEERRLLDARNIFLELRDPRGRRAGSGAKFKTRDEALKAFRAAIITLCTQEKDISRAAIGRSIGRTYQKSLPDDDGLLKYPGKQVDRWEESFSIDVEELIHQLCPSGH